MVEIVVGEIRVFLAPKSGKSDITVTRTEAGKIKWGEKAAAGTRTQQK